MNSTFFNLIREFSSSIIETNTVNILLLIMLLIYVTNTALKDRLENRRNNIFKTAKQLHYNSLLTSKQLNFIYGGFKTNLLYLEAQRNTFLTKKTQAVNEHYI